MPVPAERSFRWNCGTPLEPPAGQQNALHPSACLTGAAGKEEHSELHHPMATRPGKWRALVIASGSPPIGKSELGCVSELSPGDSGATEVCEASLRWTCFGAVAAWLNLEASCTKLGGLALKMCHQVCRKPDPFVHCCS